MVATKNIAYINPRMLLWARKDSGYSAEQVAKKANIKQEKIVAIESGQTHPTIRQLRTFGKIFRRPAAFFYLNSPPEDLPKIKDYRTLPDYEDIESPRLFYEIRRAFERRSIMIELVNELQEELTVFNLSAKISESHFNVADRIRKALDVTYKLQTSWASEYEALKYWLQAIEKTGIIVFQASRIPVTQMRGFNISERPYPVIVLNATDSPRGRIFTLLHEFTHVLLQTSGICDLHEDSKIEEYCNRVAGEALVPESDLLGEDIVGSNLHSIEWNDNQLLNLSNKYMVSKEVILRKLLIAGKTTTDYYEYNRGIKKK